MEIRRRRRRVVQYMIPDRELSSQPGTWMDYEPGGGAVGEKKAAARRVMLDLLRKYAHLKIVVRTRKMAESDDFKKGTKR